VSTDDRLHAASLGALIAYAAALSGWVPILLHFPRSGSWGLASIPGEVASEWYGRLLVAVIGALMAGVIANALRIRVAPRSIVASAILLGLVVVVREAHWFAGRP
jgi:hypothetical protein